MKDFTFLTEDQIWDENEKPRLEVLEKYGNACAITDFAILQGAYVSDFHTTDGNSLADRTGRWWTSTQGRSDGVCVAARDGGKHWRHPSARFVACRPASLCSDISKMAPNGVRGKHGLLEIYEDEYPQTIADDTVSSELERNFSNGNLRTVEKIFTTDSKRYNNYDDGFTPIRHQVYELNGKKYVRVKANLCTYNDPNPVQTMSNGKQVKDGEYVWVKVEPIKYLIDEEAKIVLAEKLLFPIQFNQSNSYDGDFSKTDVKYFLDNYFAKEIVVDLNLEQSPKMPENERKSRLEKLNPDTTPPLNRRRMTDTEIIQNWIDAGQSVLLRGPSGIGKTERIKTLYPDLIYIKLTNNMFPEKVVGSMNLQTGQSVPPDFAKQALLTCSTEEERKLISENIQNLYDLGDTIYERSKLSNKKIIIMLDELLNVKPAVQSLVYTLVLNRLVETGKGLKLPANTVIVATGNQKKYSSVAEDLVEPLEKRFDHIFDMEPKVFEWINEYAIPNKIHPSVIGYIYSKYVSKSRSEAITDMNYFYEEPEVGKKHLDRNGCKGRTNDPRGWTSISNTLYAFENDLKAGKFEGIDVENILLVSVNSKLREEWAREFYNFYNIPTLSVEKIVSMNYTQADLPRDINERFAYTTSLLLADENQVGACREFIGKYSDKEYQTLYEMLWIGNDPKRMEKILELQTMSLTNDDMNISSEGVVKRR